MRTLGIFHPRERRLALGTLLIVGSWIFVSWVVQPLWDHRQELTAQLEAKTEKLIALKRLIAQGSASSPVKFQSQQNRGASEWTG